MDNPHLLGEWYKNNQHVCSYLGLYLLLIYTGGVKIQLKRQVKSQEKSSQTSPASWLS